MLCHGVSSWRTACSTLFDAGVGGGGTSAVRMPVRADDGGVDRDLPVDLPGRVGRGLDLLEQALPRPADMK
ncbi:hypothetical protein RKD30_006188 [Streptomyces pristinaespiralis]